MQPSMKLNILILGVSRVGKTCLLLKYFDDVFHESPINTIGIDHKTKFFKFDRDKVEVNYLDSAGQERFKSITANFLRQANGVMLVYSITDRESFKHLEEWMKEIQRCHRKIALIILGNKCDLAEQREVFQEEGMKLIKKYACKWYEVSALNGRNVNTVFEEIAYSSYESSKSEPDEFTNRKTVVLSTTNAKKKTQHCCA